MSRYVKLVEELREYWNDGTEDLRNQAADAIEELVEFAEFMLEKYAREIVNAPTIILKEKGESE